MTIKIFFLLFCVLFNASIFAQLNGWKSYTSIKNINNIVKYEHFIWASGVGGIYKHNITDSSYNFYRKSEGLSQNEVTAFNVINDTVWIGNSLGYIDVLHNDNIINRIYDFAQSDKSIKGINHLEHVKDSLIVATDFGVSVIDINSKVILDSYGKFGNFTSNIPVYIVKKNNVFFIASSEGVAIQKQQFSNLSAPDSWMSFTFNNIGVDEVNDLGFYKSEPVIATDDGIWYYDGSDWSKKYLSGTKINKLITKDDSLFVLLSNSVEIIVNDAISNILTTSGYTLNNFYVENSNYFLIATDKGILTYKDTDVKLSFPDGPTENYFYSITIDQSGKLWAGSGRDITQGGIYSTYDGNSWDNFLTSTNPEIVSNSFHNVTSDNFGNIFFSSWGRGLTILKNNQFINYNTDNSILVGITDLPQFLVIASAQTDNQGNIWILNWNAADRNQLTVITNTNEWYQFSMAPTISTTDYVENFLIDRNNTKWFGVFSSSGDGKGLYYFNENGSFSNTADDSKGMLTTSNGLNDNQITALALDNRGEIWIGTPSGVNVISNPANPQERISGVFNLRLLSVTALAVDPVNQKWVGSSQGITLANSDGSSILAQYDLNNSPLPTNEIKSIAVNKDNGLIYFGTNFGLTSLSTPYIEAKNEFNELFIYPNPLIIENGETPLLKIDGLIKDSEIKIITVSGKLIAEFSSPGGRMAVWDGTTIENVNITSGVYFVVAYEAESTESTVGKFVIIRK